MSAENAQAQTARNVLVVDDSRTIRSSIADHLRNKGYRVTEAGDGIEGLNLGLTSNPNVIVLDVVMPGIDGFRLCQLFRDKGLRVPVILLTERTELEDKVKGFSAGADDYLGKPFSPVELELRIEALLRRSDGAEPAGDVLKHGELEIDLERHIARLRGAEVSLTPIEFSILKLLASTPGRVHSRTDLLNTIWATDYEGYRRNIDPHVNRLRTKIEDNPKKPRYILTVWGIGYKFSDTA